ncbi:B-lymphocyte antigen CD20 isoform X1 [Trichosurus vulpecula]|uniref:B-lymphocyte antigen CD20 isoform X1 n=1 Tax=Trichosurus vulpecula TaxID=9337 RepID=UPI00186AD65E|nr:B-lymphocyte antigen CD20 isoform X1 [Trichosurus vulpecula]
MMPLRNSVSGIFPADSKQGPSTTQPGQKMVLRRGSQLQSPSWQSFFKRESKALGAVQIMIGLFHFGLGGILLLVPMGTYTTVCVAVWYPFWGGIIYITSGSFLVAAEKTSKSCLVNTRLGLNAISLFCSISGIALLILDILNLTVANFLKLQSLNLGRMDKPHVNVYSCEQNGPSQQSTDMQPYCLTVKSLFLGILAIMLIFTFLQNVLVACIVEDEWKTLCSGTQTTVLLLSAEERKEQVIPLTVVPSQPKDEEEMETLPAQEDEKDANFPAPPQESSPPDDASGSP